MFPSESNNSINDRPDWLVDAWAFLSAYTAMTLLHVTCTWLGPMNNMLCHLLWEMPFPCGIQQCFFFPKWLAWILYRQFIIMKSHSPSHSLILKLSLLGKSFSRQHTEIYFSYFVWKTGFNIACKCNKCQILFSGKSKNKYTQFDICWISLMSAKDNVTK